MFSRLLLGLWLFMGRLTFLFSWSSSNLSLSSAKHREFLRLQAHRSSDDMSPNGDNHAADGDSPPPIVKRLLCVRHGISVANEWMSRPGNQWGDANFRDEGKPDSPLSETGRRNAEAFLKRQFQQQQPRLLEVLDEVELVLISPLTRCLETFQYGVEPILIDRLQKTQGNHQKKVPILALPLLRERVYTTSDTGRAASVLARDFPTVDFSECPAEGPWWYTGSGDNDNDSRNDNHLQNEEWRPHDKNQWYGVPGEPPDVFAARMALLDEWIASRPETTILMVTHWGVLQHLTNGTQFVNAEAKLLEHSFCPVKRKSVVSHI